MGRNALESARGIQLTGYCCALCGWDTKDSSGKSLVEGAHVREFCSGHEFDVAQNIIALCPNHHAEFDAHLFYIDPLTRIVHSHQKNWEYEGVDISMRIKHILPQFLSYAKYQYDVFWNSTDRKIEKR